MFYRIAMFVLCVGAGVDAVWSYSLGDAWLTEGYGLNPMIAFPLAFIALVVGMHCLKEFIISFRSVREVVLVIDQLANHLYESSGARCHDGSLNVKPHVHRAWTIVRLDRIRAGRRC